MQVCQHDLTAYSSLHTMVYMTNTAQVQIGQVSTRKGARLHADINNRARCGSGRGWIIPTTRRDAATLDGTARICLHCLPHIRQALADVQQEATAAQGNAYSETAVRQLQAATAATLTDAECAELDALAADINRHLDTVDVDATYQAALEAAVATVQQAPAVMALPVDERPAAWQERREQQRPRNLRELAAAMRAEHPQHLVPRPRRTRRTPVAA